MTLPEIPKLSPAPTCFIYSPAAKLRESLHPAPRSTVPARARQHPGPPRIPVPLVQPGTKEKANGSAPSIPNSLFRRSSPPKRRKPSEVQARPAIRTFASGLGLSVRPRPEPSASSGLSGLSLSVRPRPESSSSSRLSDLGLSARPRPEGSQT